MEQLTATFVLEKMAEEQLETNQEFLVSQGGSIPLISEMDVTKQHTIYLELHGDEEEGIPLYRVYEIVNDETEVDEVYESAKEALGFYASLREKYTFEKEKENKGINGETLELSEMATGEILDVEYVSVWNGGFKIQSTAKWNASTGEVFDITTEENEYIENNVDPEGDPLEILDEQYIELSDGLRLNVTEIDDGYYTFIEEENVELEHYDSSPCHLIYDLHINGHYKGHVEAQFDDGQFNGVILFTSCYEEDLNDWNKIESRKLYEIIKNYIEVEFKEAF